MSKAIRSYSARQVVVNRRLANGERETEPVRGLGYLSAVDYSTRKAKGTLAK